MQVPVRAVVPRSGVTNLGTSQVFFLTYVCVFSLTYLCGMCVCVCVCVCVCLCTHTHTHTHTYVRLNIHIFIELSLVRLLLGRALRRLQALSALQVKRLFREAWAKSTWNFYLKNYLKFFRGGCGVDSYEIFSEKWIFPKVRPHRTKERKKDRKAPPQHATEIIPEIDV